MGVVTKELSFNLIHVPGYEKIVEIQEENSALHAIIAIHSTRLGPALGGIRAYPYKTFDDALTDVLRLSRGMTYKAAIARTGTGGGKGIIMTKGTKATPEQLIAFAEAVNAFEGSYICAEDVGVSVEDLEIVRKGTHFVVGLKRPGSSGDPSRFTAWGGYRGIQAVCQTLWKTQSVKGKTVAVQGLGAVGMKLASALFWEGAHLIVADVNEERCELAAREFGAKIVGVKDIVATSCDIFAPCAMGGILNSQTIPFLRCKAVAGLANNQLLTNEDGVSLFSKGILYAPDYVINAGGLINVSIEIHEEGYHPGEALNKVDYIYHYLLEIFGASQRQNKPTHQVADEIAEENLAEGIGKRSEAVVFHH